MIKYKLLKDFIMVKAGTEKTLDEWTALLPVLWGRDIGSFPEWFKEVKSERIEVRSVDLVSGWLENKPNGLAGATYEFKAAGGTIPQEKYSAIKGAIEGVLNPDSDWAFDKMKELTVEYKKMTDVLRQKKFTEADIKDAIASVLVKEIKPFECDTKLSLVDNYFNDWLKQRK